LGPFVKATDANVDVSDEAISGWLPVYFEGE